MIEAGMGVTAGSLATLRPLLRNVLSGFRASRASSSASSRTRFWPFNSSKSQSKATSSDKTQVSDSYSGTKKSNITDASQRTLGPLNTIDAPDFLDITTTAENPSLESLVNLDRASYVKYNPTPTLANDMTREHEKRIEMDQLVGNIPEKPAAVLPPKQKVEEEDGWFGPRGNRDAEERWRNIEQKATWWPLPGTSVVTNHDRRNIPDEEKGVRGDWPLR